MAEPRSGYLGVASLPNLGGFPYSQRPNGGGATSNFGLPTTSHTVGEWQQPSPTGALAINPLLPFFGQGSRELSTRELQDLAHRDHFQYPEAFKAGTSLTVPTQVLIKQITDADTIVIREVLPVQEWNGGTEFTWDQWQFDDATWGRTPEEAVSRIVTSNFAQNQTHMVRKGLAILMEKGFFRTEKGRLCYAMNLKQVANAWIEGLTAGAMVALMSSNHKQLPSDVRTASAGLGAHLVASEMRNALIRNETANWGIACKRGDAILWAFTRADTEMRNRRGGGRADFFIHPPGLKEAIVRAKLPDNFYILGGDAGRRGTAAEMMARLPRMMTGGGVAMVEQNDITVGRNDILRPMMRAKTINNFVQVPRKVIEGVDPKRYKTDMMDVMVFDEDRNQWMRVAAKDAFMAIGLFERRDGDTSPKGWHKELNSANDWTLTDLGAKFFADHRTWGDYLDDFNLMQGVTTAIKQNAPIEFVALFGRQEGDLPTNAMVDDLTTVILADEAIDSPLFGTATVAGIKAFVEAAASQMAPEAVKAAAAAPKVAEQKTKARTNLQKYLMATAKWNAAKSARKVDENQEVIDGIVSTIQKAEDIVPAGLRYIEQLFNEGVQEVPDLNTLVDNGDLAALMFDDDLKGQKNTFSDLKHAKQLLVRRTKYNDILVKDADASVAGDTQRLLEIDLATALFSNAYKGLLQDKFKAIAKQQNVTDAIKLIIAGQTDTIAFPLWHALLAVSAQKLAQNKEPLCLAVGRLNNLQLWFEDGATYDTKILQDIAQAAGVAGRLSLAETRRKGDDTRRKTRDELDNERRERAELTSIAADACPLLWDTSLQDSIAAVYSLRVLDNKTATKIVFGRVMALLERTYRYMVTNPEPNGPRAPECILTALSMLYEDSPSEPWETFSRFYPAEVKDSSMSHAAFRQKIADTPAIANTANHLRAATSALNVWDLAAQRLFSILTPDVFAQFMKTYTAAAPDAGLGLGDFKKRSRLQARAYGQGAGSVPDWTRDNAGFLSDAKTKRDGALPGFGPATASIDVMLRRMPIATNGSFWPFVLKHNLPALGGYQPVRTATYNMLSAVVCGGYGRTGITPYTQIDAQMGVAASVKTWKVHFTGYSRSLITNEQMVQHIPDMAPVPQAGYLGGNNSRLVNMLDDRETSAWLHRDRERNGFVVVPMYPDEGWLPFAVDLTGYWHPDLGGRSATNMAGPRAAPLVAEKLALHHSTSSPQMSSTIFSLRDPLGIETTIALQDAQFTFDAHTDPGHTGRVQLTHLGVSQTHWGVDVYAGCADVRNGNKAVFTPPTARIDAPTGSV